MPEISIETIDKMTETYGSKICDKLCAECRQCEKEVKCSWRYEAENGYKAGIYDILSVIRGENV